MAMMICGQCDEAVHAPGGEVLAAMDEHKVVKHGKTVSATRPSVEPETSAPHPAQRKSIRRKR